MNSMNPTPARTAPVLPVPLVENVICVAPDLRRRRAMRLPLKRIARLLAASEREGERAVRHFVAKAAKLDRAIALGVPLEAPIALPDGRRVVVRDQFAVKNTVFKASSMHRFVVTGYKQAREGKERRATA